MQRHFFTLSGYNELTTEKEKLEKERPEAVSQLKKAREMGDLSENGFYKGAKAKLGDIDRRLRFLTRMIQTAKIIEKPTSETIEIGSIVVTNDGVKTRTLTIVGVYEANPSENKISHDSPIGKALLGRRKGEKVKITTPSGHVFYTIESVTM
ncbi:MAG: GreA/GreB family elongation factor [Candidatus Levyibacteriota bacterium]